jgi:hypothetical protein
MGLPKVSISVSNDNLKQTLQTSDGIAGLLISGVAVTDKIQLNDPTLYTSLKQAEDDGITASGGNSYAHKQISDFYSEAGTGAELYVMLTSTTIDAAIDKDGVIVTALLDYAQGKIRLLGASVENPGSITLVDGLQDKVHLAAPKAQALAEEYFNQRKPISAVILEGAGYNNTPADLKDYRNFDYNRVAIVLSSEDGGANNNGDVGSLLGRLAKNTVQRRASAVEDGPIEGITSAKFGGTVTIEDRESEWETIHNKGYIIHRTHQTKGGIYFSSDQTLTATTDDFDRISKVRVIDKAVLLGYADLLENLEGDFEVDSDGKMDLAEVKGWQGGIEQAIGDAMVPAEASAVEAVIDADQNLVSSSEVIAEIKVQPRGYAGTISAKFGLTTQVNS